jgi:hypothetical protein
MRRIEIARPTPRAVALIGIAMAVLLSGCNTDNVSFFISGNVVPEVSDGLCELDPGGQTLSRGRVNVEVALDQAYAVFPVYTNQIRSRQSELRANPNGVNITRAQVELRGRNGETLAFEGDTPNPFSVRTSTFIPSGEGNSAGRAVGEIPAIPPSYRMRLQNFLDQSPILVAIKVFGETNGDTEIETEEWVWPVELCTGNCLFTCAGEGATGTGSCVPGQDISTPEECACNAPDSSMGCPEVFRTTMGG